MACGKGVRISSRVVGGDRHRQELKLCSHRNERLKLKGVKEREPPWVNKESSLMFGGARLNSLRHC